MDSRLRLKGVRSSRLGVRLGQVCKAQGLTLAAAESCTGGLLSNLITNIPGSSEYFMGAVISYSNDVKVRVLGVRAETLKRCGAVSARTASEMCIGVMARLGGTAGVAITGIAGPGGGSTRKPVGTVYVAVSTKKVGKPVVKRFLFKGTRLEIKKQSAHAALNELLGLINQP